MTVIFLSELCSFLQNKNLELHKEECVKKDFCGAGMPFEENKKLKFIQHLKSIKAPSLIYADLESSIKEIRGCKNN